MKMRENRDRGRTSLQKEKQIPEKKIQKAAETSKTIRLIQMLQNLDFSHKVH